MPARKQLHQKGHRARPRANPEPPDEIDADRAVGGHQVAGEPLVTFSIDSSECVGCMLCAQSCPRKGITGGEGGRRFRTLAGGERKKAPTIEQAACVKCGTCFETCPFGAVKKT